jgi:methyl-accepting chemotaxis protein
LGHWDVLNATPTLYNTWEPIRALQIRDATGATAGAICEIGATIGQIDEIATTVVAAVEEQGGSTKEIARSV